MDHDPYECYEAFLFESKEDYEAVAVLPGQKERYQRLLDIVDGPIEWHDGNAIHLNHVLTHPEHYPG